MRTESHQNRLGLQMTDIKQRLSNLEDRRIEILMEIGEVNREYGETMSLLESEYARLTEEYYELRMGQLMSRDRG